MYLKSTGMSLQNTIVARAESRSASGASGKGRSPFPDPQALVVGGGHESLVVVDESDGVDGAEMSVVLLDYFPGPGVPLRSVKSP